MAEQCIVVMIAVDGSHNSDAAVKWYAEHSHVETNGVILVYICDTVPLYSSHVLRAALLVNPDEVEKFEAEREAKIKSIVDKYTELCRDKLQLPMRIMVRPGRDPGHTITELAEVEKCGLIVVGSRGHGLIRKTILGATSAYVLHHSSIPVAIYKHD